MMHPFEKIFYKALPKSDESHNEVIIQAEKLLEKGYSPKEIGGVLKKLQSSLIDTKDIETVAETLEELGESWGF